MAASGHYFEALIRNARDGDELALGELLNRHRPWLRLLGKRGLGDRFSQRIDLRVDGVSSFAFSDTKSEFWIIAPKSHVDIIGWHKSNSTTTEFKVVDDFADSAAAKLHLKPSASIGLITAAFRAAWEKTANPPADEMQLADLGGRERSATGFGKDVGFRTTQVSLVIGDARDIISVRYNR